MNFNDFVNARTEYSGNDIEAKFPPNHEDRGIHVLWMYPDTLNMHGGKGNLMALARYAMLLNIPITIRKCIRFTDQIDFQWADLILFESGDLVVMKDILKVLRNKEDELKKFADSGKFIMAIGSSGTLLAKETEMLSGEVMSGLGLLNIRMKERSMIYGDDLWFKESKNNLEIIGTEVMRIDTYLDDGQAAFGQAVYGRGNNQETGNKLEGARTNNTIFTNCLGPIFARNPYFAEEILKDLYRISNGVETDSMLGQEDIKLELNALEDMKEFIKTKMK